MPRIFISYRHEESAVHTGWLYEKLAEAFGEDDVFKDVFDIDFGVDFPKRLEEALNECDVLLVVIGRKWLKMRRNKQRRIDDPNDFVRREIRTGLSRAECTVIPVLIENASMPKPAALPEDIRALATKQAVKIGNDPHFSYDVARLIESLQKLDPPPATAERLLEAAMPCEAHPDDSTEVRVKVSGLGFTRLADELRAIVPSERVITEDEVRSSAFPLEFERAPSGELLPGKLCVEVVSKHFEVSARGFKHSEYCDQNQVPLTVPPDAASQTLIFTLTPIKDRVLPSHPLVKVHLLLGKKLIAEVSLTTSKCKSISDRPLWSLVIMPLAVIAAVTISGLIDQLVPPPSPARAQGTDASIPTSVPKKHWLSRLSEPWAIIIAAFIAGIFGIFAASIQAGVINLGNDHPKSTSTPDVLQLAAHFSGNNGDWSPVTRPIDGVEMVLVPTGCFMMGSDTNGENQKPAHRVCLTKPFWIDRTEVTNEQFAAFGGTAAAASFDSETNFPRTVITRDEAQKLCEQRGGRLPTEAEWEYAARGPDDLLYPWGNAFLADDVVYSATGRLQLVAVGSKPLGQSWVGALDLSGSVWEWVYDTFAPYPEASKTYDDPVVENDRAGDGVIRGGSYSSQLTDTLRATQRLPRLPTKSGLDMGFRCVIPVSP